jgi:hypothetical protein
VIQEILSGRQGKLEQIIAVVEMRPEAETKRKEAGLKPEAGYDRGRQIYYDTKAFCWTLMVMAGLNLIRLEAPEGYAC